MAGVERLGDREVHHDVAEELEAFVVTAGRIRVFVQPTRMDEGLFQQVEVPDGEAQSIRERPVPVAPPAWPKPG